MRILISLLILALCLFFTSQSVSANPFKGSSRSKAAETQKPDPLNPVYMKLAKYQQKLTTKLSGIMKDVKRTGNYLKLMPLIMIAFFYGVIHAAGPGHGKALAASYLVSRGRKIRHGFFFGSILALLHGLSGIAIVLFLKLILRKSVMSPLTDITHITKVTSYSIILAIGLILTLKNLYSWYLNIGVRRDFYSEKYDDQPAGSLTTALIVGMIPCPGTVIIMLFALSINMIGTGVILSLAQTLGMAVTISVIGMIVVGIKKQTLDTLDYKRKDLADRIERFIETAASIAIATLGGLLLSGTLS